MFKQILRYVFIPIATLLIIVSSFVLEKSPNIPVLYISAFLFTGSVLFYNRLPFSSYLQLSFLAAFHFASHLNWCQLLYMVLIVFAFERSPKMTRNLLNSSLYALVYTMTRLTYLPINEYNLLVSIYDLITFMLIVFFMQYLFKAESEKRRLQQRNHFLSTHDPLTNLLNYEGYVHALKRLINKKNSKFALVLLDLQDFKSVNSQEIRNGNEVLILISNKLKTCFSGAIAISRYAGDRFALILPQMENTAQETCRVLESNALGYEVIYSITLFPDEAGDVQDMIGLAEDRLFQNKRKLWLKREEEIVRSEKMKIVGELAAGMAHEIRNPLTTMQGFIQLSKSQSYNIEPWFPIIMNEITRMNELTAEFLQFSKPHIGNMKPEAIAKCIDRVMFLTESQALSCGHNLHMSNVDESILVRMDRDKIVQVLLNLTRNAVEAMKASGDIFIRARQEHQDIVIEVEDTGVGIPDSELASIFDPFYTTKENGTGLGLSICFKIIQDHSGTLDVRSVIGQGSVFVLKLPVAQE